MAVEISLAGVVLGAAVAIVSGITTGWILERKKTGANLDGILASIHDELEVLGTVYSGNIGGQLEQSQSGTPFLTKMVLRQKYFIVYPNNTGTIGQLKDEDLRRSIIVTYNTANFILEVFEINNLLLDFGNVLFSHRNEHGMTPQLQQQFDLHHEKMVRHADSLRDTHRKLKEETDRAMAGIRRYREAHPVWFRDLLD